MSSITLGTMEQETFVLSSKKLALCGQWLRVVEYGSPFKVAGTWPQSFCPDEDTKRQTVKLTKNEILVKSNRRAVRRLIDAVNCNYHALQKKTDTRASAFLTLTSTLHPQALPRLDVRLKQFLRALSDKIGYRAKYAAVVELQPKSGYLHYHLVLFDVPFIPQKEIQDLWGFIVDIRSIPRNENVGLYMAKYLTKDNGWRLPFKKRYRLSRGLRSPLVSNIEEVVNSVLSLLPRGIRYFRRQYYSHYMGTIHEYEYDLNNSPGVIGEIHVILTMYAL